MNTYKLSNVSLDCMRRFLRHMECTKDRVEGGHEVWVKKGLTRPLVLQTHVDPVPEFIVKNLLRTMGLTRSDFVRWIKAN